MKRAIGPVVTTGVALVVAGVIVANPVIAPRADVQIPAVKLSSGSDETAGMLDKAFLDAIAPAPPESTNPFAVLKQLISSLAADATYIGKNALVDAFVAGVTAVSQPELTSAWSPYVAPSTDLYPMAAAVLPTLNIPQPAADGVNLPAALLDPALIADDTVAPAVQQFVTSIVNDVGYVGVQVVSAAFAAGQLVAAEPAMIAATLRALVNGDIAGALTNAVKVVIAPLGPPAMIVDALRTVVEKHLTALTPAVVVPAAEATPTVVTPTEVTVEVPTPTPALSSRSTRRAPDPAPSKDPAVVLPAAATATAPTSEEDTAAPDSSEIRRSARASADAASSPVNRKPAPTAHQAVKAIGDQIGAAVSDVADAVGRVAARAGVGGQGSAPQ